MKKLSFLFCLIVSLLILASVSQAISIRYTLKEATLGRRQIAEDFNIFIHDLAVPPAYADTNYQYRLDPGSRMFEMTWLDLVPGRYLFRFTPDRGYDAYTGTPASIYTGRETTLYVYEAMRGGEQTMYLQRRDQLTLDVKVVDADTGYGISGANVHFGSGDGGCRFRTVSGGVMMGPELNSGEMIGARPGDVQAYSASAAGYPPVAGTFTATPRSDNPAVCTELRIPMRRISTTPSGSKSAPPASKSAPRPKSIPRL